MKTHDKSQDSLWSGYSRNEAPKSVHDCYYQCASNDAQVAQLWAYTGALSYASGSTARLHVNTSAETYDVVIFRDGATVQQVFSRQALKGCFYPTLTDCSVNGCDWPVALDIPLDPDWPSGGYIVRLNASAPDGTALIYEHVFFLRPGEGDKKGRLLLVAATGTWAAYNDWGGSNHYEGITGLNGDDFSPTVSQARPFARGFVSLPADAPRVPFREPPEMGAEVRYPHMDWAYANGYSKKYASAGWAMFERPYVHWLEQAGYKVDLIAQHDLQFHPEVLDGYDCVTLIGHDEYWSWEMRDAIDDYVDKGGNIARFAGNFMWQTRVKDDGQTQVCYKYRARAEDPVCDTIRSDRTTNAWDAPETGRPGAQTFGLSGTFGIYAGWGGCCPRGAGGFTVYRPDHWIFAGSDVYYGDILGASSKVFGYEVDGVDYIIKGGLPYATGNDGAPENLTILGLGLATVVEVDHGNKGKLFIGTEDAEYTAIAIYGEATPETIENCKRGSGMMVLFNRGQGCVFNAGSSEWIAGLIDRDPQVERVTQNVLNRFLSR